MITKEKIERINQLAKKAKSDTGLSDEEKIEQKVLRDEYIAAFKANLKSQLDQIEIVDKYEESKGRSKEDYIVEIEEKMN